MYGSVSFHEGTDAPPQQSTRRRRRLKHYATSVIVFFAAGRCDMSAALVFCYPRSTFYVLTLLLFAYVQVMP